MIQTLFSLSTQISIHLNLSWISKTLTSCISNNHKTKVSPNSFGNLCINRPPNPNTHSQLHKYTKYPLPQNMEISHKHLSLLCLALVSISSTIWVLCDADPTDGFTLVPLTDRNIGLQKPYNMPLDDRYSYNDGVRSLWVYTNDKPFYKGSGTRPRTDVRIKVLSSFSLYICVHTP